jgi:hypothetical protein
MANYFQQFTGSELAQTGYKPQGPNPFLGQAGLPMGGPMGAPMNDSLAAQAGLPQFSYDAAARRYRALPQQMPSFVQEPVAAPTYDPSGYGAAGGMMPSDLRFDKGGKAEFNDLSEKEKKKLLFNFIANSLEKRPGEEYSGMSVPQGAYGRAGVSADMADNSRLRAGLSGVAMAVPGQHGVRTMPGAVDIGYTTARNSDYDPFLDLSASRSINPMPGKGYAQSVNAKYTVPFVQGGQTSYNLGGYSDGGRLLKGPGDGMSDNIPASIGDKQPARLADGEFVVPADVVSHLGNGSTDAGAKKLYAMMDKVRTARVGTKKQGKEIKAEKYLKT